MNAKNFFRYNVTPKTISNYFRKCIHVMAVKLKPLIYWPDRDELIASVPECFKQAFGNKVATIIDCFEVFIEKPSNLRSAAECWSSYKHHYTAKELIGITPRSSVAYVSDSYGGRTTDKFLTEKCGLLNNLLPGDVVLADRGFTVEEAVAECGAFLNIPAFTRGTCNVQHLATYCQKIICKIP